MWSRFAKTKLQDGRGGAGREAAGLGTMRPQQWTCDWRCLAEAALPPGQVAGLVAVAVQVAAMPGMVTTFEGMEACCPPPWCSHIQHTFICWLGSTRGVWLEGTDTHVCMIMGGFQEERAHVGWHCQPWGGRKRRQSL